jgi:hypothetical protein
MKNLFRKFYLVYIKVPDEISFTKNVFRCSIYLRKHYLGSIETILNQETTVY